MKRSKLFLGITAGILAVVGFVSAKSRSISTLCYITTAANTVLQDHSQLGSALGAGPQLQTTFNSGVYDLFTYTNAPNCNVPAFAE